MSSPESDLHLAYAEASIMLLESLMLVLAQRQILSIEDLTDAVENAVETKKAFIAADLHPRIATIAAGVLRGIGNSLAAAKAAPAHRQTSDDRPEL
jgi:hypothetical protein